MSKLTICRGLPGSGKSTWASLVLAIDPDTTMIVNRDSARLRMFGSADQDYYECSNEALRKKESLVTEANHAAITAGLKAGFHVICDDTNLPVRRCRELRALATRAGAEFEVKDFSHVPVETCLERNAARKDKSPIPGGVILDMHKRYISKRGLAPVPDATPEELPRVGEYGVAPVLDGWSLPQAYVYDLDGTLALIGDRSPYDGSRVGEDTLNNPVAGMLDVLRAGAESVYSKPTSVIIMSGRSEEFRDQTEMWLRRNFVEYSALYMRAEGDSRPDWQVKYDLFNEHVRGKHHVLGVFDDRDQVVKLWREMGLTCFQVNYGDF